MYARVCVEMNLLAPWPCAINLFPDPDSTDHSVINLNYETLLEPCFYCGRLDHPSVVCPDRAS